MTGQLEIVLRAASVDLLAYFQRRVAVREDAADLLGETMLQAWKRADALPDGDERRRMWLFTIASNVHANHRRAAVRRSALVEQLRGVLALVPDKGGPEEAVAVRDAVRRLPPGQRELVMLVHWEGFTLAQAAEVMNINASTARSRYAAARASLEAVLAVPVR